ncbi:hypothetical protein M409DRAFT_61852 [Zasmidium cellare ATCC 36951]|uniref:RWD domain-containing protein n=1 Tax=Zasmidium cellare ATCC 36951 TaxID=1080233 RepID=A0A6A6D503_ZASCE|nr:uncharacterized protein M409DRAFT_61852 [Zasmidium cellare ATCC 36951]KAF2173450.1 hypothetical protein M409DRAFT_61852 [Zasmidium cellare ATCC 36951]
MASERDQRLAAEIALLESMYPEQATFTPETQELSYTTGNSNLQLRLTDGYLVDSLPVVLSANAGKQDLRNSVKESVNGQAPGEEVLDSIILSFNDMVESLATGEPISVDVSESPTQDDTKITIIVFLHHLLNTNKRKLCLSPSRPSISGVTKPGYPGVLVYSGPLRIVHEHINELKAQNWQAFQVRSEFEGEEWKFRHGTGVVEVEGMGDVVAEVDFQPGRKEAFMEAMRMK